MYMTYTRLYDLYIIIFYNILYRYSQLNIINNEKILIAFRHVFLNFLSLLL